MQARRTNVAPFLVFLWKLSQPKLNIMDLGKGVWKIIDPLEIWKGGEEPPLVCGATEGSATAAEIQKFVRQTLLLPCLFLRKRDRVEKNQRISAWVFPQNMRIGDMVELRANTSLIMQNIRQFNGGAK